MADPRTTRPDDPLTAFGPNEWLVDELYQQYLVDKNSVDKAWWAFFADYTPEGPPAGNGGPGANGAAAGNGTAPTAPATPAPAKAAAPAPSAAAAKAAAPAKAALRRRPRLRRLPPPTAPPRPRPAVRPPRPSPPRRRRRRAGRRPPRAPTARAEQKPEVTPKPRDVTVAPKDGAGEVTEKVAPLRGPAARVVTNMESSLHVPTATSVRAVPAKLLIDNRVVINNHLARSRGGKVSFTHLIGFALVKALRAMPEMNNGFAERDGKPVLVTPAHVNLGLAIDMTKPDGTRQLLVPSIKAAETMDFVHFWSAYEDVVRKARGNKLTVEDFQGTTISLTNPGTIGTNHSVPRLMEGQGAIIGVGALEYPAEWQGASTETLNRNAVSKILTLTSTYDHRIIQGAQSGDFLRFVHQLLLGEQGFYDEIFESLRIPYEPIRWVQDISATHDDDINKVARVQELIHAYRVRGHLMADTDPLEYRQRKHADLDVTTHGLSLWDLDRSFATGGFGGEPFLKLRRILGVLRDSYCRTVGIEYMHIQDPEQRAGSRPRSRSRMRVRRATSRCGSCSKLNAAEAFETFLQTKFVGQKRFSLEGGESVIALLDRIMCRAADDTHGRDLHRHAAPRPAQRAGQHRRQVLRPDLPRVRGPAGPEVGPGLRRREVPPRHRGRVHLRGRLDDEGLPRGQPVAPRGRRPGARGHRPRQAGPAGPRRRGVHRAADPHARRRGLRRPGRRRRDAAPVAAARLPHRRHHPRRHQQPGRLHHLAVRVAVLGLLDRRRADDPGADLPRQRRRPRGVRAGGRAGLRVPPGVQQGRRHRHGLLPPPRPQRGRRPVDDAAADVQPHRGQALGPQALHRGAHRPRRHLAGGRRGGAARLPAAAGAGVPRDQGGHQGPARPVEHAAPTAAAGWRSRRRRRPTTPPRPAGRTTPASRPRPSSTSATPSPTSPRASPSTPSCGSCSSGARR